MSDKNFTITILVDKTPQEVFDAINNVRGWWSENIEGDTYELNAEFLYQYKDVHVCKMKITELIPDKKIVWHVMENHFSFTNDKSEWKDNYIVFDIITKENQTQLRFSQYGLTPANECFNVCNDAWTDYISNSLRNLIMYSKGQPTPKDEDGELNEALINKWKLNENKNANDFSFSFESSKSPEIVFKILLNVRGWWSGLYGEKFEGSSKELNDEFEFIAGDGAHYSKQKLIESEPNKKIVWLVADSNLNFLKQPDEWTNTKIRFDISEHAGKTKITFTHQGLVPQIECYNGCTNAWTQYLKNLSNKIK